MTARNSEISEIRRLLELYYEGKTSPGQQRRLCDFFAAADSASLPEDLRADAAMFSALAAETAAVPPSSLVSSITEHISHLAEEERRRNRRHPLMWWALCTAAAAAIALLVIIPAARYDADSMLSQKDAGRALADVSIYLPAEPADSIVSVSPEEARIPEQTPRHHYRHPHHVRPEVSVATAAAEENRTVEINSPEKARKIALRALSALACAERISNDALNSVEERIDRIDSEITPAESSD